MKRGEMPGQTFSNEEAADLVSDKVNQDVNAEDKRRTNRYRKFGQSGCNPPFHHHPIMNMSKLRIEAAAAMIRHSVAGHES
jgi:hypothetical protein